MSPERKKEFIVKLGTGSLRFVIAFLIYGGAAASANTLVIPNPQTNAPGNFPINLNGGAARVQQVLGSGQFPGPVTIIGVRIRSSPGTGVAMGHNASLLITFSTTQAYPNTGNGHALPSPNYASNLGPDATVVYNGPFSASTPGCAAPGPCPFDVVIPLSTPFSYDPSKGRLLFDEIVSAPIGTVTGSLDGIAFTDPTASPVASVSGDPSSPTGMVLTAGFVVGLDISTPCVPKGTTFPCSIGGSLYVNSAAGNLFGGSGGGGGGGGAGNNTTFVNDAQAPGITLTLKSPLEPTGPAQQMFSGTLNLATVSGQPTLKGVRASVTCGVTGNATGSMAVTIQGVVTTLTCPKTATPGVALPVFGQASFTPVSSVTESITLSLSAPSPNDTVTFSGYGLVESFAGTAPSVIADSTGVINGGSYAPGEIVSGSWVAVKGSGFTDPGVTMDWSNSDFSKGLPTSLNGVQVLFNGQPGAMWYLIDGLPQQINVQAPNNLSGKVSVQVVRNNNASNVLATTAVPVAPGIFSYSLDGGATFFPSAVFLDGTRLGDPTIFPGARQAKAGDTVVLFANSLAASPAGVVSVSATTHPVTLTIGGTTFAADFSGLVAPGEFQINFTVPKLGSSGNLPVTIQIDGQSSQSGVLFPFTN
jgi:uncharacterized protein (TIGR03437 family)